MFVAMLESTGEWLAVEEGLSYGPQGRVGSRPALVASLDHAARFDDAEAASRAALAFGPGPWTVMTLRDAWVVAS